MEWAYLLYALGAVGLIVAVRYVWHRFEAERKRQVLITQPRRVVRIEYSRMQPAEAENEDDGGGYLPEFQLPYYYYQGGDHPLGRRAAWPGLRQRCALCGPDRLAPRPDPFQFQRLFAQWAGAVAAARPQGNAG